MTVLLKLLRDCPQYGGYAGEEMAFDPDVAESLVRAGRAAPVEPDVEPEPAVVAIDDDEPPAADVGEDTEPSDDDDDEGTPEAPRRRGRPRKIVA